MFANPRGYANERLAIMALALLGVPSVGGNPAFAAPIETQPEPSVSSIQAYSNVTQVVRPRPVAAGDGRSQCVPLRRA